MIVTKIYGGLGNQMFQFAAGRALSLARNEVLGLDINEFDTYALHQGFELKRVFGLDTPCISRNQLARLFGWRIKPLPQRLAARWARFPFADKRVVIERQLDYWSGMADVPANAYLRGYWQSDRYFQAYADTIRSDFKFKEPLNGNALTWSERIQAVPSVSLHIRRGDYVSNAAALAYHGVCSLEYYRQAIITIASQIDCAEFFVFSDDLDWVRENLRIEHVMHFVANNIGASSYRDMQLMSLCRHHIIANSSFSWWGAWLNKNIDKLVIAPARWFAARPTPDGIHPKSWTLI